jgi:transcriptional regulator with XRE-family HTH domain
LTSVRVVLRQHGGVTWAKPADAGQWQADFGANVRGFRKGAGLTQQGLATLCDLSVAYISSVELGHRNVSLVNIHVLAAGLQVRPADLLDRPLT